jgi:hypothetical protein
MAVYKVIQDIEAEDKLVGFLTLKTFIYAIIAASLAYINVRLLIAGELGPVRFIFVLILAMPMLVFGILAAPLGRDQPTEVWILSHIKFYLNSRKRIWDQSGAQELVTITVPKKIIHDYTKGLSPREVRSRLKALATTLDSRGWAVKNVAVNLSANPSYLDVEPVDSDRLVTPSSVAQKQQVDVHAADDIMDEQSNPTAQHFESLMQKADVERKQKVKEKINVARQQDKESPVFEDTSFLDQTPLQNKKQPTKFVGHKIITPGSSDEGEDSASTAQVGQDEQGFLQSLHQKAEEVHAKSAGFKPKLHKEPPKKTPVSQQNQPAVTENKPAVTEDKQNAKLKELIEVAKHDKLSTLAKEANRNTYQVRQTGPNELEIDLH